MTQFVAPDCPWCGGPPVMVLNPGQALCGNDTCPCFMWDPSATPAANRASSHEVEWPFDDGTEGG